MKLFKEILDLIMGDPKSFIVILKLIVLAIALLVVMDVFELFLELT